MNYDFETPILKEENGAGAGATPTLFSQMNQEQSTSPQNPYANMSLDEIRARKQSLMKELGITDVSQLEPQKPIEQMSLDEIRAKKLQLMRELGMAPNDEAGQTAKPQPTVYGRINPAAIIKPSEAAAKGKRGAVESAALERAAETGQDNDYDGTVLGSIASGVKSFATSATGGVFSKGANNYLQSLARGVSRGAWTGEGKPLEEMPDSAVDYMLDQAGANGLAGIRSWFGGSASHAWRGKDNIMRQWDESEGLKYKNEAERKKARVEYAKELARGMLGIQEESKLNAESELAGREETTIGSLGRGLIQQGGYTAGYVLSAPVAGTLEGGARAAELMSDKTKINERGEIVTDAERDSFGTALAKGAARGVVAPLVELVGGKLVTTIGGKAISATIGKIPLVKSIGGRVSETATGKAVATFANKFNRLGRVTGMGSFPEEMVEEWEDQVLDAMIGLDRRASENEGTTALGRAAESSSQFFTKDNLAELAKSMVLMQVLQSGAANAIDRHNSRRVDAILEHVCMVDRDKLKDWTANQKQQAFTAWVNGLSEKDVQNMVDGGSSALDKFMSEVRGGRNLRQIAGKRGVGAVVANGRGGSTAEQVNEVLGEINASVGKNDFVERDADGNAVLRKFAAPTAAGADGKVQPAWTDAQDEAGDNVQRLQDAQSGVTIDRYGADRDDDTPEFNIYDTRGRRRSAQTYEEAVKRADEMAADSASRNAKLAYIDKLAGGVLRNQQVFVGDTITDIRRQYDAKYGAGKFDANMASGDGRYLRDESSRVSGASFWVPETDANGNSTLVQERDAQGNPVFVKDESGSDVPKMVQQRAVFFCLDGTNNTVDELNATAYHEVARHSGLAKMYSREEKADFLKRLTADSFGNTQGRDALAAIVDDEMKFRGIKSEAALWKDADAVEEIFARVTETTVTSPSLKQKFMANVYKWYRNKFKSDLDIQPDELAVVVDELNRFAREGGGTAGSGGVEYENRERRIERKEREIQKRIKEREDYQAAFVSNEYEISNKADLLADSDEAEFKDWLEWQGALDTEKSRVAFLNFTNGRKYALTVKNGGVVYGKAGEGTDAERAEFYAWQKERDEKRRQDKIFAELKAEEEAMAAALPGERKARKQIDAEAEKNRVTAEKERAKFVRKAEKMRKAVAAAKAKEEARAKKEQDKANARKAQIDAARNGFSSNDEERAVVSRLSDDEVLRIYGILKGVVSTDDKAYKRAVNRVNKILEAHNASMDEDGNFRDNASDELARIVEDVQGAIDEVERRILERTNKEAEDAERASREAGLVEAFSRLNDERNGNAESGGKGATRDALRNDPVLKDIDAAYAEAQTDEERDSLKERFRARVVELMKHNAPKTPQDAPAQNTGDAQSNTGEAQDGAENGENGNANANTATATNTTTTQTDTRTREEIPLNEFTDEQLGQYLADLQANESLDANGKARLVDARVEVANRSKSFNNWLADQRRRGKAGRDTDETRARFEKAVRAGRVDPRTGAMVGTTKQDGPNARFSINVYAEETGDRQPQEFRDAGHFFVIPNGLMEYRKALANWKKRKDASPANRPTMAQFGVEDPMADWIDNFLDGATAKQKFLLFGFDMQKGANDGYVEDALNRSPLARMIVEQNGGVGDANAYAALAEAVLEANSRYSEWRDKKVSEDAESRMVDNERKESEAVWEASYDDLAAAHDAQNAEWESALGEIESADAFGPNDEYLVPFNRSNLTKAKRGDIIRLGSSPVEFMLESYDAESGVLTIVDSFGEGSKPRKFKVTENEVKEIDDGRDSQGGDQDNAGNAGGKPEGAGSDRAGQGGGEGNAQNGSAGNSDNGLTLESVTSEQIKAERKRREQKAAIAERLAKPLKGSGPIEQGQTLLDLGGAEGGDLFNRVQRTDGGIALSDIIKAEKSPKGVKIRESFLKKAMKNATQYTRDSLVMYSEDNPAMTVRQIRALFDNHPKLDKYGFEHVGTGKGLVDPDLVELLDAAIKSGYGDVRASALFAHRRGGDQTSRGLTALAGGYLPIGEDAWTATNDKVREYENMLLKPAVNKTESPTPTDAGYAAWAVGRDGKPLVFANEREAEMSRAMFDMLVRKGRIDGRTGLPITGKIKPLVGNARKQAENATQNTPKNTGATQPASSANAPTGQGTPVSANHTNGTDDVLAELAKKARAAQARLGGNAAKSDAELKQMRASAEKLHHGKIVGAIDDLLAYREAARRKEAAGGEDEGAKFRISNLYTGSAADYEKPSLHYVGTGEGSQVYGWGLYASNRRGVAESYIPESKVVYSPSRVMFDGKEITPPKDTASEADLSPFEVAISAFSFYKGDLTRAKDVLGKYLKSKESGYNDNPNPAERKIIENTKGAIEFLESNGGSLKYIPKQEVFRTRGHLYEQTFFTNRAPGDESHLLKWYEPVSEENKKRIADQLNKEYGKKGFTWKWNGDSLDFVSDKFSHISNKHKAANAEELYARITTIVGGKPRAASEFLARADIDGVKYPVDSYGGKTVKDGDKAGWNYATFRDDNITVDHKWVDGEMKFRRAPVAPAEDAAYMDAVKRGDTETAQRMVRESAAKAGYGTGLMHGTNNEFTEFKPVPFFGKAWFFTDNDGYAKERGANVKHVFVDTMNFASANLPIGRFSVPDHELGIIKKAKADGRDGVVINAVPKAWQRYLLPLVGMKAEVGGLDKVYVVFDGSKIKSADPVTYDDAGNVIPLSQRFNPENPDIRFRRALTDADNTPNNQYDERTEDGRRYNAKYQNVGFDPNAGITQRAVDQLGAGGAAVDAAVAARRADAGEETGGVPGENDGIKFRIADVGGHIREHEKERFGSGRTRESGMESRAVVRDSDGFVYKYRSSPYSGLDGERVKAARHNTLFGERTPYEVVGYAVGNDGDTLVLRQPYIEFVPGSGDEARRQLADDLRSRFGGVEVSDDGMEMHAGDWVIDDLKDANIGIDKNTGKYAVIDAIIHHKNDYGGELPKIGSAEGEPGRGTIFDMGAPESGDIRFRRAYAPDPALRHLADALNLSPEEADALANTADALEVGSTRRDSMPSAERELVDAVSDERGLRAAYDTSRNLAGKFFGRDAGEKWHAVKRGLERRLVNYLEPVRNMTSLVERKTLRRVKTEDNVADAAKFAVSHQTRMWEDADRGTIKPLYKEIADNGLKASAKYTNDGTVFDELLLALHGPAFNRMISERTDGRTKDGSGASTAFWLNVLRGHGANGTDEQLLDAITRGNYAGLHWAKDSIGAKAAKAVALVRRLNNETRDVLEKSGRLSNTQRQTWENLSPFYVPMRFDQDAGDNFMKVWLYGGTADDGNGYTKNYTAPESRHAFGHRNVAESPVAFSIQQFSTAIQRATDNDVRRKLAGMVRANPFLGEVIDPNNPAQAAKLPHGRSLGQNMKTQQTLAVNALEQNDNIVAFKENGDTKFIVLGPKTAASGTGGAEDDALSEAEAKLVGRAIKKTSLANPNSTFKAIRKFTRAFAVMRTTLSPEFLVSNFLADNAQAAGNLYSKFGANGLVRFEKNVIPALLASIRHERGKANPAKNRMDRYVDEWRRNGGLIGGLATEAVADINKSMEREVAKFAGDRKAKLVDFVLGFAEKMNKPFEQASRIASYVVCREKGMSEAAAAKFAREVTVDFNQKGEWGPILNSIYAFSNAALVDMGRSFEAFGDGKAKGRAIGYGVRYGIALVAMGLISSMLGFWQDDPDDEREGKAQWKDAKDYVKQNKLGARVGQMFASVPIRGINRELYYAGHKLFEVLTGRASVKDAAMDVGLFAVQNAVDPIGDATKPAQAIAPSVARPAVELMQNENFTGAQIYRQPMNPRTDVRSEMGRATTPKIWREIAKGLNSLTGGNRNKRGLLDKQPEVYQHLFSWITGSVGNDAARAANLVNDIVTGDFSDMDVSEDAGNLRNVPFVRRVFSGLQGNSATFRDKIAEYTEDKRQFEDVAKEDEAVMSDLRARHPYYENTAAAKRWRQELADLDKAQKRMMKIEMSTEGEDRKAARDLRMKIQAAFVRRMEVAPGDEDAERKWFDRQRERETQKAIAQDKRRKELEKMREATRR